MIKHSAYYRELINSTRWHKLRALVIARDKGLCQDCLSRRVITRAAEVHHIRPVDWAPLPEEMERRMFDERNLVSLCRSCHRARHVAMASTKKAQQKERRVERALTIAEELTRPAASETLTGGPFFIPGEGSV